MTAIRHGVSRLAFLFAVAAVAAVAQTPVSATAPVPSAGPAGTQILLRLTGLPAGTIAPADVAIQLTPAPGNGGARSIAPLSVAGALGSRDLRFVVPASLAAGSAPYSLGVTVTGRTGTGATFYNATPLKFLVTPAPRISSLSVNALNRGATQVPVEITGEFTQWSTLGLPVVSLGEGVTISELARSPLAPETRLTAKLTVAANAPVGPRTLMVAQGSVVASGSNLPANSFTVLAAPPVPLSGVSPAAVAQGAAATIDLYGSGFTTASQAYFGEGVTVNQMVFVTPTHIQAVIQANPYAYPGFRPITVVTGGSFATGQSLQVTHKLVSLQSVYPASLPQGRSETVTILATGTNFLRDATQVSFSRPGSGGIVVGDVVVVSPTELRAEVAVTPGAPLGMWAIRVTTGGESLNAGQFTVTGGTPLITQVSPPSGLQGAPAFPVTLTSAFTTFTAGTTIACAGGGLTIGATTLLSPMSVRATFAISSLAAVGARACTAKTGGTIVPFTFQVNAASGVQLLSLSPGSGRQGSAIQPASIRGVGTNFVRGTTVVSLRHSSTGFALTIPQPVTVLSSTEIDMAVVIPAEAPVGPYHLQVQTGGEVLSLNDAFRVLPATPQVSVTPSSLPQQAEQTLVFNGSFTNWGPGTAIDPSPTPDIEYVSGLQVQSATQATLRVRIRPRANFAFPSNPYLLVLRTTVDSPFGPYQEAVGAGFVVARGPARLSVNPPSGNSGARIPVTIQGEFTNFRQGLTTVAFGCGAQVLTNPATVVSPAELRVEVQLPTSAALVSNCPVSAITEGEQADGAFELRGIAPPVISSVTPNSAAQGETRSIVILGTNTNWAAGTTVSLGVGVTVIPTSITPTRIEATVSVVPTTATGTRPVTVTTGTQVLNYGVPTPFAVTPGPAEIRSLSLASIAQGQNLKPVIITGRATNFLRGSSVPNFGPGIAVNSFTVESPTQATAVISASLSAPLGLRTVQVTTDGEVASISTAFSVTEKQPVILSVSPVSAPQGTTVEVTVLGEATSFSAASVLSLGPDIDFLNVVGTPTPTRAVFRMRVGPLAITSTSPHRTARVTTGTEVVEAANAFFATPGSAAISSLTPGTAMQGKNAEILVSGQDTNFQASVTTVSISVPSGSPAIAIGEVIVRNASELVVRFAVPPNAATGLRTITVSTRGEVVSAVNALRIDPGLPVLVSVLPTSLAQGQRANVTLTTQYTSLTTGTTAVSLGAGVTINSIVSLETNAATRVQTLVADVTVSPTATVGARTVTLTTGGEIVSGPGVSIVAGPARLLSLSRTTAAQGEVLLNVEILGELTNFVQDITLPSLGPVEVQRLTILSATRATADLRVPLAAPAGTYGASMTTGGETANLANAFTVTATGPATITRLTPSSGTVGTTLDVEISGNARVNWTAPVVSFGPGITINGPVQVQNPQSLRVNITIASTAVTGARTISVTQGDTLTTSFSVQPVTGPGAPSISGLAPASALAGQTLNVSVVGANTNFEPGVTLVSLGAGLTLNRLDVLSRTSLVANITVAAGVSLGARSVTVTTGGEVVTGSFSIVAGTPSITSISPNFGFQGGAPVDVTISGEFTLWQAGTVVLDFGPGITVSNVVPAAANQITARLTIARTAATGNRFYSINNGAGQVVTAGLGQAFRVDPSNARLLSVTPASARQGATVDVVTLLANDDASFAAGTTTLSFGSGITFQNLAIVNSKTATVRLLIDPLAAVGPRDVTVSTGGEVLTLAAGLTVDPGTPTILSITPTSARQGEAFSLLVEGRFTNWNSGATPVPSLGEGIDITGVTVNSATQLTIAAKVKPRAVLGARTLTILQGGQPALTQTGFTVTRGPAEISSVSLPSIKQLEGPLPITVTGLNTNFDAALTSISFGAGVTVANLRNVTATSATVDITVAADAAPGFRTVSAITEGEVAELIGTFRVEAGAPVINSVTFAGEATQGRTFDLTIDGRFLTIDATTTAVFAPAGITVNSITNVPQLGNNFRATVNITVQATTALGARGLTLATGTATATRASVLNVVPGAAAISGVTPNRARRGQNNVEIVVEGTSTTFGPTTTFAFNPSSGITNVSISAGPNTQATVRVNLDAATPLGARSLTLTTGGEVATLANAFTVDAAVLDISTLTLPYGTTGQNYNQTVAATGGAAPFNFTLSAGTLPGGVTLNPTSGLLSGVPTTAGAYSFTVQVTDGSSQTATKAYTVNIYDPLTISTTALDAGLVGLAYSRTIIATGGAAPRTFALQSGTLPGGLTLDPATGTLAGSPLTAATSSFTVRVTDNVGQTRDQAYNVTIYPALVFTTAALPAARSTVAYNQTVAFAGGVPSVQVEVASGALPGGLTVSNAGVINGTPSATGTFNFELKLTDAQLNTKLQAFSIAVTAATSITTTSLPNGVVGRTYAATVATTDGVDPLEFSISAGSLPNSLSIGATTGVINGTPSLAGTFNFTVRVKDAQNFIVTREYTVTIAPPPQLISISRADLAQALSATIDITGLNTNFVEGTTVAHFGLGVTVLRTRVTNLTQAQVDITVDSNAAPGPRTVTVTTGAEVASRTDFFTVLAGLPEISAIAPAAGRRSTTVAVTVTGRNLLGASFALRSPDPSFTTPPGTVSIVSNDGTMAVLSMALGATEGQFNLAATTPLGASLPLAGSQFVIAPGNGSASASASVLNTFAAAGTFPGIPGGRNTATFYASVLNTALSESATPSIPAGRNTATFYASVLNTALNESANPSLPPGRSTATFYASVLNTGFNVSGAGLFSTAVALPVWVCNEADGPCRASQPLSIAAPALVSSFANSTAAGLAPMLEPVETQGSQPVIAGQSILLEAREAGQGATVEFEINGVSIARLSEAPYATLFTVPASVKELTFRVLVRSAEGVERASRLTRLAVVPDLGATVNGTASFAPGTTSEGVTLHLAAGGLKAEYFDFAAPLTERPNLTGAKPTRTSYVSAVNQPNPDAVFGDDPLGTGLTPDLAVRYTGELWVETGGLHRFRLSARSGASLRIDGEPVLDTGFTTGAAGRSEISVELKRGWHAVELVYAHGVGPQSLRWEWQRPGDARLEVVDQRHLRTPLDLISAVPDGEGNFSFTGVPAALDTVWVRSVRGKKVREYPALRPGGADPVRIVISQ